MTLLRSDVRHVVSSPTSGAQQRPKPAAPQAGWPGATCGRILARVIGVDWGTSSFRAFRIGAGGAGGAIGAIGARIQAPRGIATVPPGGFPAALRELVGAWLQDGERQVLMCGMVGSRQGWQEAPYLPCPADAEDIARSTVPLAFDGAAVRVVAGLSDRDADGVPDVMRGEETQLLGVMAGLAGEATACLPGSHSKWARLSAGRIEGFATYLSGEAFAAIRAGTILGRMMPAAAPITAGAPFLAGVARAGQPGHLLHHLFGVRGKTLFGELAEADSAAYLSGLLIGTELRAAMPPGAAVHLVGDAGLCALYAAAIAACGGRPRIEPEDAAARGLMAAGKVLGWV
jgi:2-dehydro-3-deoxygalactonokinase